MRLDVARLDKIVVEAVHDVVRDCRLYRAPANAVAFVRAIKERLHQGEDDDDFTLWVR